MPELAEVMPGIEEGYSALLSALPVAGRQDALSSRFPWPEDTPEAPQSKRYADFVAAMSSRSGDVIVGASRVALDAPRCLQLGSCLSGCPLELFFSPGAAITKLASEGRCSLVNGPVIEIAEHSGPTGIVASGPPVTCKPDLSCGWTHWHAGPLTKIGSRSR